MGGAPDPYAAPLRALSLPDGAHGPLLAYLHTLDRWASRVNLTAAAPAERVALLVAAAAPVAPHLPPGSLLDVGSGNGSPGLVLAALRPELRVTLLEPRQRRWAFLREAARAMGRADVAVERARHDAYAGPPADAVIVRALSLPLGELERLAAPGGVVIVMGRPPADAGDRGHEILPGIWRYARP